MGLRVCSFGGLQVWVPRRTWVWGLAGLGATAHANLGVCGFGGLQVWIAQHTWVWGFAGLGYAGLGATAHAGLGVCRFGCHGTQPSWFFLLLVW